LFVAAITAVAICASLSRSRGQVPSADIEQQIRSHYRLTKVGANGTVVGQAGSVLVIQEDGLVAIPASYVAYWYNTFKKDGHIKPNAIQHVGHGFHEAMGERRPFQVGEKIYLTDIELTPTDVVFNMQSCGKCGSPVDPSDAPYRARLAFQFDKGYLNAADPKRVLATIGRVFGVAEKGPEPPGPVVPLKLPSAYVSAQTPSDHLQLNDDHTFSLQEAGQMYSGTFTANDATVELKIKDGPKSTATIQGDSLTDSSGQTWVLQKQPPQAAGSADVLQNQDILKMVQAGFDDATILAKIGSSKCRFDTSTGALIQLKQSGVSAAVLKAILGAAK